MKYFYGILLFFWAIFEVLINYNNDLIGTGFILIALCLFVIKEKFLDNGLSSCVFGVAVIALSFYNPYLLILLGIVLVDMAYFKKYLLLFIIATVSIYLFYRFGSLQYSFQISAGALWGYFLKNSDDKEKTHITLLDNERALRYQLEKTKVELVRLQNEIERTAELRERDRIAKEIHDNVGHSIAGILFQLRAAERLIETNSQKVGSIVKLCIEKLVETLEVTRNTVQNMKSSESFGIEGINKLIESFKFCKIDFVHNGDLSKVSAANIKVIEANTKELLTNAMKYSSATKITLQIDIHSKHIRCLYRDNGLGCDKIKESVGLSAIRERVGNLGGTYSIDGNNGFMVVYTMPNNNVEDFNEGTAG